MAPRAIVTTGWKIYIFFAVFNVLTFIFVYFFCPETNQKSLEEINFLFEKDYEQAIEALHASRGEQNIVGEQAESLTGTENKGEKSV
jgi:hypothetical protein